MIGRKKITLTLLIKRIRNILNINSKSNNWHNSLKRFKKQFEVYINYSYL